jgi:hypothetical protein
MQRRSYLNSGSARSQYDSPPMTSFPLRLVREVERPLLSVNH